MSKSFLKLDHVVWCSSFALLFHKDHNLVLEVFKIIILWSCFGIGLPQQVIRHTMQNFLQMILFWTVKERLCQH